MNRRQDGRLNRWQARHRHKRTVDAKHLAKVMDIRKRIVNHEQDDQNDREQDEGKNIAKQALLFLLRKLAIDFANGRIALQFKNSGTELSLIVERQIFRLT